MKTAWLVVCQHGKQIEREETPELAKAKLLCKKCRILDLVSEKWTYKDVRVYRATPKDTQALTSPVHAESKPRHKPSSEQLDWVG